VNFFCFITTQRKFKHISASVRQAGRQGSNQDTTVAKLEGSDYNKRQTTDISIRKKKLILVRSENEGCDLLAYDLLQTFQRNIPPPPSLIS
jgi:hypothetical protein